MKKFWLPQIVFGTCCLWSGLTNAQSSWDQGIGAGASPVQPNGYAAPSPAHLYGYSQVPQPPVAGGNGQFNGGSPAMTPSASAGQPGRYPLPAQLPNQVVPPAGMTTTTTVAGGFTVGPESRQQSFPVTYRQDIVAPQQPGVQAAPPMRPAFDAAPPQYFPAAATTGVPAPYATMPVRPQELAAAPSVAGGETSVPCGPTETAGGLSSRLGKFVKSSDANWVVGVNALIFARDYEDDKGLSYNAGGEYLYSTDADLETFGGIETVLSRRNCSGSGWEARYWGLYPQSASNMINNMPGTVLAGLQNLDFAPTMTSVLDVYNAADWHRVTRDNSINNLELNLLRNGGCFTGFGCRNAFYELLGGFRWFQFDEYFAYSAINTAAPWPSQLDYAINTRNTLLGFQLGGRTEWCVTDRLRLTTGLRGGLFNNRISHTSRIADTLGNAATIMGGPFNGTAYDFSSTKDDIAFLGELDTGFVYQISSRFRLNFGYRLIAVNGVALAPNQFPYNFTDARDIERIDSNGSLLLHGGYAGAQFCF